MNKLKFLIYLLLIVGLLLVLKFKGENYYDHPTYITATTVNAIIEIPAGSNDKVEYNVHANKFVNSEGRKVDFLPYPGNYGFIPSTLMDTIRGGDGDALDILVISKQLAMKTVVEVKPIAILKLLDNGEKDDKIIAVPIDEDLSIISIKSFAGLKGNYPEIMKILESWFSSYKGADQMQFLGWEDENQAMKVIAKWNIGDS